MSNTPLTDSAEKQQCTTEGFCGKCVPADFARKLERENAKLREKRLLLRIELQREDNIPAFGAFLRCEEQSDESAVILLNVAACMCPEAQEEDGTLVAITREERKRLIISHLMHEFGHALESHFKLPVNEEAIEAACQDWEKLSQPYGVEGIPAAQSATGAGPEGNEGRGGAGN